MSHPNTEAVIAAYNTGLHEMKIAERLGLDADVVRVTIDEYWVEVRRRLQEQREREAEEKRQQAEERACKAEERRLKLAAHALRREERRQRAIEHARLEGERDARRFVRLYQLPKGNPPAYLPTPQEISEACDKIQAGWSEGERRVRWEIAHGVDDQVGRVDHVRGPCWTPQMMRTVDFCIG